MKIELLNSNGEHVAHTELPPFKRAPGVVIWGDRVFSRLIDLEAAPEAKPLYREAFAYVIPDGDAPDATAEAPDHHWKFAMHDVVQMKTSEEFGEVIGRTEFAHSENSYYIRYKAGDGRQVHDWVGESGLFRKGS